MLVSDFVNTVMNLWVPQEAGIWLAETLIASQGGLSLTSQFGPSRNEHNGFTQINHKNDAKLFPKD
jgi:hypothetical protein